MNAIRGQLRDAFASQGSLFATVEALARSARADRDDVAEALADMDVRGEVQVNECNDGVLTTLTDRGAGVLGLKAVLRSGVPMWAREEDPEEPLKLDPLFGVELLFPRYVNLYCGGDPGVGVHPSPGAVAAAKSNWAGPLRTDNDGNPMPCILQERPLWDNVPRTTCRTCQLRGVPRAPEVCCLECDRWGLVDMPS
jgi:hypothetical protein